MDALWFLMISIAVTLISLTALPNIEYSLRLAISILGAIAGGVAAVLALMVVVD